MTDIIWGNGAEIISNDSFVLNVTHRKDGNSQEYSDVEKIKIIEADVPGLSHDQNQWEPDKMKSCLIDAFLKCEIQNKDESGMILAKVSHSGVGGY